MNIEELTFGTPCIYEMYYLENEQEAKLEVKQRVFKPDNIHDRELFERLQNLLDKLIFALIFILGVILV